VKKNDLDFNLLSFTGKIRTLHLTWFAFFLTFTIWFNHAPLLAAIKGSLGLTQAEVKTIMILNVALTIPARVVIGMLVDKFGPRLVYSILLFFAGIPCMMFAMADTFGQLAMARFLMGGVGAGFVIGIRMVSEWFPPKQVGLAEGVYGGWGNFGSAASALTLPTVALLFGGEDGWRYAIGATGLTGMIYSFIYYNSVRDTPEGKTYFKPKKSGAMEVTSMGDFIFYLVMRIPMYSALALLTWKLSPAGVSLVSGEMAYLIYAGLVVVYVADALKAYTLNHNNIYHPVPKADRYKFKQVAILDVSYFVTFGSELAVVSMLPLFFLNTFDLTPVMAGMLASGFAFMNLVARPVGGWLSDHIGRKKTLLTLLAGLAVGYYIMSHINSGWMIPLAVMSTMMCSFFVQSGEGAVFAIVPLVKRRLTGQVAGMAGAYGNVGAVTYLTILSFVDAQTFFLFIGGSALFAFVIALFLDEPSGVMTETMPDGTVREIEVG